MNFDKLRWRIDKVSAQDKVADIFPQIGIIFDGTLKNQAIKEDILHRYIIYCYHQNSPLVEKMLEDVRRRKIKAFELAGLELGKEADIDECAGEIIKNENTEVGRAILQFLKFEDSVGHMQIVLQTEALYQYNHELIDAKKGTDKTSTVKAITDLTNLLDKVKSKHYRGDDELINFVASTQILENRRITPEDEVAYRKAL